jgi:Trk-type K+ transport system membrane component
MNNEQFLIASYFTVGALVVAIGLTAHAYLRRPLAGTTRTFRNRHLGPVLRRLFPVGLVLPALAGFLSVDYHACHRGYASIITDRPYMIAENQDQISTACLFLLVALLVWGIIVLISLATRPEGDGERDPR